MVHLLFIKPQVVLSYLFWHYIPLCYTRFIALDLAGNNLCAQVYIEKILFSPIPPIFFELYHLSTQKYILLICTNYKVKVSPRCQLPVSKTVSKKISQHIRGVFVLALYTLGANEVSRRSFNTEAVYMCRTYKRVNTRIL